MATRDVGVADRRAIEGSHNTLPASPVSSYACLSSHLGLTQEYTLLIDHAMPHLVETAFEMSSRAGFPKRLPLSRLSTASQSRQEAGEASAQDGDMVIGRRKMLTVFRSPSRPGISSRILFVNALAVVFIRKACRNSSPI